MIQCDGATNMSSERRTSFNSGEASGPSSAARRRLMAGCMALHLSASSKASSHFCSRPARSAETNPGVSTASSRSSFVASCSFSRRCTELRAMPRPYSAVSSKRDRAQAGPCPCLFVLKGLRPYEPPQTEEQPLLLAMTMRSPNICVRSFTYGVSPQPEQAPLNSIRGSWNCEPFTLILSIRLSLTDTALSEYSQCSLNVSCESFEGFISRASSGHISTHTAQPVQSYGATWMVKFSPPSSPPLLFRDW
mmetsp:Transcript_31414/g.98499  ORF Transcript_31414/g.98499 Transcript_31414/m.98499 type:complete len:249 (+) Transcript_31414:2577-3323(+)